MTLIDARGMRCPWPAIRAARALRETGPPLEILADDPATGGELARLAEAFGVTLLVTETSDFSRFRIEP
jgi:tRNA 2-thiouridine synthesizing protein A